KKRKPKKNKIKKIKEKKEEHVETESEENEEEKDDFEEDEKMNSDEENDKTELIEEDSEEKKKETDSEEEIESDEVIDSDEFSDEDDFIKEKNNVDEKKFPSKAVPKIEKEVLKNAIIQKALNVSKNESEIPFIGAEKLEFLSSEDKKKVFIGRKTSIFKKYGFDGGLHLGRVKESAFDSTEVFMDSLNPHVVFVCGARGSGKSYVLGVIAEELAKKNKDVGIIAVDPIGVFWSMRYPNKEENEVQKLFKWGLKPEGLDNLKVFIPVGAASNTPKSTYDDVFSMQPSLLTGEDWCLTFGIDRFSVTGLLLEKALSKVDKGYIQMDSKDGEETVKGKKIAGKKNEYSLDDIVECLSTDSELNSKDKGYKPDSIRAIVSRFEAAKTWGIFSETGTPLSKLSRANQLTVLDTSFLDDNVTALVIGILARRTLAARKISTRKEASQKFKELNVDQLLELDIPPTWLFIDEAHTLIPAGNEKTAATTALVEYVKQGRRPGCSLVFATQQPSAIDTKVLSQLDIIMVHKLVFDDDIKAVYKRTPTLIPNRYRKATFIKTLPVGIAVTGDRREETTRMFVLEVRPRMSQHEGRDAETGESNLTLTAKQIQEMAVSLILKSIQENGFILINKAVEIVEVLNSKYKASVSFESVLNDLKKKDVSSNEEKLFIGKEPEEEIDLGDDDEEEEKEETESYLTESELSAANSEQKMIPLKESKKPIKEILETVSGTELRALPLKVDKKMAAVLSSKLKKNAFLGFLGASEEITSMNLVYSSIYEIEFAAKNNAGEFISHKCFIDSVSGEFIHFKDNEFIKSKGFKELIDLSKDEIELIKELLKGKQEIEDLFHKTGLKEDRGKRLLSILYEKGFVGTIKDNKNKQQFFFLQKKLDLPLNPVFAVLESLGKLPFVEVEAVQKEFEAYSKQKVIDALQKFWPNIVIKKTNELLKPKWIITLNKKGFERKLFLDAVTGKPME
ncbi:MAG: ATP-binding protein, partial [Candidatus Diapherotrites archaeon]|nr:ATP-binding protein [Candidatus Diapherotrites archaeon]